MKMLGSCEEMKTRVWEDASVMKMLKVWGLESWPPAHTHKLGMTFTCQAKARTEETDRSLRLIDQQV